MTWEYAITFEYAPWPDGRPWVIARHPELPGCMSDGATVEDAARSLADARESYLRAMAAAGIPVDPPDTGSRVYVNGEKVT